MTYEECFDRLINSLQAQMFHGFASPSWVSCHTMPSRLTLVPGWQGPKKSASELGMDGGTTSCVLVPTERVLTALQMGGATAGGKEVMDKGGDGPAGPAWPGAGAPPGGVNMDSTCRPQQHMHDVSAIVLGHSLRVVR